MGTPDDIRARTMGHARVEIRCDTPLADLPPLDGDPRLSDDRRTITVSTTNAARTLVDLVRWIDQRGIGLTDVHLKRPSLEDVFIELTGKSLRE